MVYSFLDMSFISLKKNLQKKISNEAIYFVILQKIYRIMYY